MGYTMVHHILSHDVSGYDMPLYCVMSHHIICRALHLLVLVLPGVFRWLLCLHLFCDVMYCCWRVARCCNGLICKCVVRCGVALQWVARLCCCCWVVVCVAFGASLCCVVLMRADVLVVWRVAVVICAAPFFIVC